MIDAGGETGWDDTETAALVEETVGVVVLSVGGCCRIVNVVMRESMRSAIAVSVAIYLAFGLRAEVVAR